MRARAMVPVQLWNERLAIKLKASRSKLQVLCLLHSTASCLFVLECLRALEVIGVLKS